MIIKEEKQDEWKKNSDKVNGSFDRTCSRTKE